MPEILGTSKSISGFDPRTIPGCLMWLEPKQFTGTGASTVWADLSGNGYNMSYSSSYTSPPVLTTMSPINGNNYVTFTGTGACRIAGSINFPRNERSIFIAARPRGVINQASTSISMFGPTSVFGTLSMSLGGNSGGGAGWYMTNTGNYQSLQITTTGSIPSQSNGFIMAAVNANATASNVWTINGTSYTLQANNAASYSSVGSAYTQYIGGGGTSPTGDWDCFEIIFYSFAVSPAERQQIEGYLAWKWNLECIPQTQSIPGVVPSLISGLSLWLDGSDPNGNGTKPANGATVSTWVDKSGNGYNATVASSRIGGTYNTASNCVYFQASNVGYATSYPANPTSETMFVVFNNPSPSFNNNIIIGGQPGARSLGAGYSGASGTGSPQVVGNLNNEVAWLAATTTATSGYYLSGTTAIVTSQFTSSSNFISLNGGTFLSGGAPGFSNSTTTYLGVDTNNTGFYYLGYAMEIIFYNSILTTIQCQTIQAYLANKWGAALLNQNGYTPLLDSPLNVPGCVIWCDASKSSSLANLSTAGIYTTSTTGQVNTVGKNSLNTVTLTTSQTWTTSPTVTLSAYTMFWVGRQTGITNARVLQSTTNNQLYGYWGGYKRSLYIDGSPGWLAEAGADTNWDMFSHSRTAGGAYTFNWDGTSAHTATTSTSNSLTGLAINTGANPSEQSTCEIAEIILYNVVLNTPQIQGIERYLAIKWGLYSSFYTSIPGSVRGLMLWLDGADASTMTFPSGSNVSGWKDKGSMGFTLSNTISGQYPTYIAGKGLFCSNTAGTVTSSNQGLRYDGNWTAAVPTQAMAAFVSYTALCNDQYRNAVFIGGTNGGSYTNRPNFIISFENGNAGGPSSINTIAFDLVSGSWTAQQAANSNTFLGPRIDAIISTPGVASGSLFLNGIEMSYIASNAYTSTYSNYMPNVLYVGAMTSTVQGNRMFHGYINEILFYSNALTSAERAVIQSYLARKWNNTSIPTEVLPLTHPFATVQPFSRRFALIDLGTTPEYWFDAADTSTITTSGNYVTTWSNKGSSTGSNLTPTTANTSTSGTTFYGGNNLVNLPISTGRLQFTSAFPSSPRARFVVTRQTSAGNVIYMYQGGSSTNGNDYVGIEANTIIDVAQGNVVTMQSSTISSLCNSMSLVTIFNSGNSASNRAAINGSNVSLTTSSGAGFYYSGAITTYIGFTSGAGQDLGEWISFNSELTLQQIYWIEGYLAWKWGIPLASGHPYAKVMTATTVPWLPTNITGLMLWLDGADTRTMIIGTASNVMSWSDKSGNGYAAISQTTPATLSSNSFGGNTSLLFNGTSRYYCPTLAISNSGYTVFTVQNTTSAGGGGSSSGYQRLINADPYVFVGVSNGYVATFTGPGSGWNDVASNSPSFYNVGVNVIVSMSVSNTVLTPYTNGTVGTTKTGTTASFSNFYIGDYSGGGQPWYGKISEIIIYNGILSTTQRQQVEGYLAWKWGI